MSNKHTLVSRIKFARGTAYRLMVAGFYGLNGVSPVAFKKMFDIFILPQMIYWAGMPHYYSNELQPMYTIERSTVNPLPSRHATYF